jgi:PAS domain S-box-containing protein
MPTETMFQEMKRYVRFSADDARHLAAFGPIAAPHFVSIAAAFYDRIREHEDAHRVFTGEEQIARLQRTLVRWMAQLFAGPHDEAYFAERSKIGRMHVKIGLPQRYMFTAMALIRDALAKIAETLPHEQSTAVRSALTRVIDLELAIMLETYREDFVARIQRVERLEKRELEKALARSEHRYQSAIESAKVLVVGVDVNGVIVLFNREAERVTGYARDEALGQSFTTLLLPEGLAPPEVARIPHAARSQAAVDDTWEAPLRTRAGKERMVHWQLARAAEGADDEIVLFAIGLDVTDARALAERTLQSERLAAVGTLAAGLAHEIRNPLNGALLHVTYLERALRRTGGNEDALETARFIGVEIQRLSALVKDFLVFARPSPPKFETIALRDVCKRALTVVADDAQRAAAELRAEYAASVIVVRVDPAKIEQVLLNLLRNAIDAVGGVGGGHVVLRTIREPRRMIVEVEDDGPGLPSPDAPIFDAFYSTKANGTGLGLAIVHRVVSDHGGTIEVESKPGRTVFRVALPAMASTGSEDS